MARAVERMGSALALIEGDVWEPIDDWETDVAVALAQHLEVDSIEKASADLDRWLTKIPELRFISIADPDYPPALRLIFNPPPFITMLGSLMPEDARGVAVVGTRKASEAGREEARCLGARLARRGVTVISGLAAGIDTAAHSGALTAGGRTLAALGHGLGMPIYPKENRELAEAIKNSGALISQFLPDTPPTRQTFPIRNAVTSGLSQGTVVIEASRTSGARMQARLAAEHDRRVWLHERLVRDVDWATEFADRYPDAVTIVSSADDIVTKLDDEQRIQELADRRQMPAVPAVESSRRRRRPRASTLFAI